jgi:anti-sigma B factor antagonist
MSHSVGFAVQVDHLETPCPLVSVSGEVDLATAPQVASCIASVLAKNPRTVVLNLSEMTFMDCSGLNVILETKNQLPAECFVVLREPQPFVRRVLGILDLDFLCAIEPAAA